MVALTADKRTLHCSIQKYGKSCQNKAFESSENQDEKKARNPRLFLPLKHPARLRRVPPLLFS